MTRLVFGLVVAVVVLTIYAIIDSALIDRSRIRGLPRWAWVLVNLLLPVIGAVLWFTIGRARRSSRVEFHSMAPDDDPEFLGRLGRDAAQEERIRKLEQELAELDGGEGPDDGPARGPNPPRADDPAPKPDAGHRTDSKHGTDSTNSDGDKPGRTDA
jgi:hypothetical protein